MRKLVALFLALIMVLTATVSLADGEKRVLRVAAESWEINKIFLEDAARIFEEAHPDVDVELITYADTGVLTTYTLNWMQGETDVDLVFLDGGVAFAKQFAAKDLICDFENDLKIFENYDVNKLKPGVVDIGRVDGKFVSFPAIYEVYGISVNKDMFKAAGLVDENGEPLPIKTWDDFYDFANKLTLKDANGVVTKQGASIQFGNNMLGCICGALVGQTGGVLADDGISYNVDSDAFRYILGVWQKGILDGSISRDTFVDNSGGRNALKAGNLAMCYEAAGRWMEAEAMLGEGTMTVLPLPGGMGTYGFGCGMVVPKCSPNGDLAAQFILEGVLSEYVQTNTFSQYGKMAVVAEYFDKAVESKQPWKNLDESMQNAIQHPIYEDQQKFQEGVCAILQAGLVDAETTPDDMIAEIVELMNGVRK